MPVRSIVLQRRDDLLLTQSNKTNLQKDPYRQHLLNMWQHGEPAERTRMLTKVRALQKRTPNGIQGVRTKIPEPQNPTRQQKQVNRPRRFDEHWPALTEGDDHHKNHDTANEEPS